MQTEKCKNIDCEEPGDKILAGLCARCNDLYEDGKIAQCEGHIYVRESEISHIEVSRGFGSEVISLCQICREEPNK